MIIALTIVHVIVCFFLVVVVLLQSGKAADLAGAFGGMGSQTAFGPRGAATVLSKATTIAAALFMMTSIVLAIYATRRGAVGSSVLDKDKTTKSAPAKTTPAPVTPQPAAPGQPFNLKINPDGTTNVQVPAQPGQAPAAPAGHQQQPAPAGKK